jgi:hypothetical protein
MTHEKNEARASKWKKNGDKFSQKHDKRGILFKYEISNWR